MATVPENSSRTAMSYQKWEDRRQYKRYPTSLSARFRKLDNGEIAYSKGIVLNVSLGGIFIGAENLMPTGTIVEVVMKVLSPFGEVREVTAEGKIVWVSDNSDEAGMGICFTNIERHTQYALLASAHRDYP